MKVTKSSQLSIKTPDKAGELAKVLGIVADAGANGLAYAGYAQAGQGHVMLVTADNAKVAAAMKKAGYEVREDKVVLVTDKDAKGAALALAKKIAAAGISLTSAYATAAGGEYLTVLEAADLDKLVAALK
ncbi:MAG: hypothetical protein JXB04_03625 [Kiritimatiellae bacterium]|nr:hypothetical protein [Kiritimatiellia bacterium]